MNEFNKYIAEKETDINNELFTRHFNYQRPNDMLNHLYKTNDINNNDKSLNVITKEEIKRN